MAAKKITTQSIPDRTSAAAPSLPSEKRIIEIVVTTNINRALMAYRVLSSDCQSFLKIASTEVAQPPHADSGCGIEVHPAVEMVDV